jgi:hypothetical protein
MNRFLESRDGVSNIPGIGNGKIVRKKVSGVASAKCLHRIQIHSAATIFTYHSSFAHCPCIPL